MASAELQISDDEYKELKQVVNDLYPKARVLLSNAATAPTYKDGVIYQEGAAPKIQTSYLTATTNFPNATVYHHMQNLIRDGLVEKVEKLEKTDPASQPGSLGENVYQCTERGIKAAEIVDEQPIGETFDALHAEIERLRKKQKRTTQLLMRVAVNTDTFTLEQAKEIMPPDQFKKVFEEETVEE